MTFGGCCEPLRPRRQRRGAGGGQGGLANVEVKLFRPTPQNQSAKHAKTLREFALHNYLEFQTA